MVFADTIDLGSLDCQPATHNSPCRLYISYVCICVRQGAFKIKFIWFQMHRLRLKGFLSIKYYRFIVQL